MPAIKSRLSTSSKKHKHMRKNKKTATHRRQGYTQKKKQPKKQLKGGLVQDGGKKLGEGGFGCVVHPGISCGPGSSVEDPTQSRRTISKIIPDSRHEQYKQELAIYRRIKKIDPDQRYLISFNEECDLDTTAIDTRQPKDLLRVQFLDDERDEYSIKENPDVIRKLGLDTYDEDDIEDEFCRVDPSNRPRNLVQTYGGRRLNQIIRYNRMPSATQNKYIAFQAQLIKDNCLSVIRDLLYGIYLMHSNKMVHRDIKYSNIVCLITRLASSGNKYPLTRHIDFGLSQDVSLMPPALESVAWQGTADRIPIEIYMLYMMANIKVNYPKMSFNDQQVRSTIIRRTMNKYRKKAMRYYRSIHLDKSFLGNNLAHIDSKTGQTVTHGNNHHLQNNTKTADKEALARDKNEYITIDDLHNLYDRFIDEHRRGILGSKYIKSYSGYIYKTDIFALGVLLMDMGNKLGYSKQLKPLVSRMCSVDPDKRPIINDCVRYLDVLLEPVPEQTPETS